MYFQIAVDLRRRIGDGSWKGGERMPGEVTLANEYQVSRVTVRQALAELVKDDLVERRHGSGTFVRDVQRPLIYELDFTTGMTPGVWTEKLHSIGFVLHGDVIDAGLIEQPTEELRQRLALGDGEGVIYTVRRILVNDEPASLYRSWFSADLVPGLDRSERLHESLALILSEEYDLVPYRSENAIEAVRGTREEAALLGVAADVPLVVVTTTTFLADGRPLEHSQMVWLGDRVRFHVTAYEPARWNEVNLAS
jgi:DNA-binding GntR family transcriptional regulator